MARAVQTPVRVKPQTRGEIRVRPIELTSGPIKARAITLNYLRAEHFEVFKALVTRAAPRGRQALLPGLRHGGLVATAEDEHKLIQTIEKAKSWADLVKLKEPWIDPGSLDFGTVPATEVVFTGLDYIPVTAGKMSAKVEGAGFSVAQSAVLSGVVKVDVDKFGRVTQIPLTSDTSTGGAPVQFIAGQRVQVSVAFDPGAVPKDGDYSGKLRLETPDGVTTVKMTARRDSEGQIRVKAAKTHYAAPQGTKVSVNISLESLSGLAGGGGDTDVEVTASSLPDGITLTPQTVHLKSGATTNATLEFEVTEAAAQGSWQRADLGFSAFGKQGAATLAVFFDVYLSMYEFSAKLEAGKVSSETTVVVNADGTWVWHAHLFDDSTFTGDNWLLEFGLPYKNSSLAGFDFHYEADHGVLGAELSGPARNAFIDKTGNSVALKQNFVFVAEHAVHFHLHVSSDPFQFAEKALEVAVKLAKEYGPEAAKLAAGI